MKEPEFKSFLRMLDCDAFYYLEIEEWDGSLFLGIALCNLLELQDSDYKYYHEDVRKEIFDQ